MKRFASSVTPSELVSHVDEIMIVPKMKERHNRITSLSQRLNQFLVDDDQF